MVVCLSQGGTPCSRRCSPIRAFFAVTAKAPWPRSVPLTWPFWPLTPSHRQRSSNKRDAVYGWPSSLSVGLPITVSTLTRWARWPPDTQRSVGPHQAGMPRNIFAPQPPTSCAASAVYGWTGGPFRTDTRPCCASSSPCGTNRAGCPTPPAGRRDGTSRGSSTTSGGGVWSCRLSNQPISMRSTSTWRCGGAGVR